jgi:tocopherol O-methyltransferase
MSDSSRPYIVAGLAAAGLVGLGYAAAQVLGPRREVKMPPKAVAGVVEPLTEQELTLKRRIKAHYDDCSPHYQDLWGEHIHHGLWVAGNEGLSKEAAQLALVEHMLQLAGLAAGSKVLDVGCGVGGTSNLLAQRGHSLTGVSLSTTQVAMAKANAAAKGLGPENPRFLEMDGEKLSFPGQDGTFDAVWISEVLSHFPRKNAFFAHAERLLKPGGKLVLVDWFRADCLGPSMLSSVITDIEDGMLLPPMETVTGYSNLMVAAGLRPVYMQDVSKVRGQAASSSSSSKGKGHGAGVGLPA